MRLRIVHQLSLLLAGSVLLSVAAVGGFVAWNLRTGFSDYLRLRDAQQLERFAQVVADRAAWDGDLDFGGNRRIPMRELVDEFMHREGVVQPPGRRPLQADAPAPVREGPPPREGQGPPPREGERPPPREGEPPRPQFQPRPEFEPRPGPPPVREGPPPVREGPPNPRPPADGVARRLQVVDAQRQWLGGPRFPADETMLEEPVRVGGKVVAYVRMVASKGPEGVDARFLKRQYGGLTLALAISIALALLAAWLAARWLGAPLLLVQKATRRIAGGELSVVVPESGSREMADLIHDVNRMALALKNLEGARRSWIAQISHELRTPLSVLLGEIESIQEGVRVPTPEIIASLREEVLQLVRLVSDLHTLSMADIGSLPCTFTDDAAGDWLERTLARSKPRLEEAGLVLEVVPGGNPTAHWDFGRIGQLVANLLENSRRYTRAPGRVRVQWSADGHTFRLVVEDTPPGVEPARLTQLFEPLYRADAARQRGGSGLGLAICRAIVQAHGGTIRAAPSALGGVRIETDLPLHARALA